MDRTETIKQMMDDIAAGKGAEVASNFDTLMRDNAKDALDQRKQEMSQAIFNNPEMVAMGLANGEEQVIDAPDTLEPETVEVEEPATDELSPEAVADVENLESTEAEQQEEQPQEEEQNDNI